MHVSQHLARRNYHSVMAITITTIFPSLTSFLLPSLPKPSSWRSPPLSQSHSSVIKLKAAKRINVQVIVYEDEHTEKLIQRFRKECYKASITMMRKRLPRLRKFFETPRDKRKRKAREASRKFNFHKRKPGSKPWWAQDKDESSKKERYDSEDDNWDFYDGEVPYC